MPSTGEVRVISRVSWWVLASSLICGSPIPKARSCSSLIRKLASLVLLESSISWLPFTRSRLAREPKYACSAFRNSRLYKAAKTSFFLTAVPEGLFWTDCTQPSVPAIRRCTRFPSASTRPIVRSNRDPELFFTASTRRPIIRCCSGPIETAPACS